MTAVVEIKKADITDIKADAIVNAANKSLLGGGGVDGAIHRKAGPALLEECKKLNGCNTGQAKITKGYGLKAGYVIHTVGPVWHSGKYNEEELLACCYGNSLGLAKKHNIKSFALPSISTGAYRFPIDKAASIALNAVKSFLEKNPGCFKKITFVLFSDADLRVYNNLFKKIFNKEEV